MSIFVDGVTIVEEPPAVTAPDDLPVVEDTVVVERLASVEQRLDALIEALGG